MIRGGIVLALIMSSMLFLWITGEGLLGFSSGVRTVLMGILGVVFLGVGTFWILIPLSKFLNLSKPISDRDVRSSCARKSRMSTTSYSTCWSCKAK